MNAKWHFRQFQPGDTVSDPIERALFSQESASSDPASALVRESIQNSLDARRDDAKSVRVVYRLFTEATAPSRSEFSALLYGLDDHVSAQDSGIEESPIRNARVPLLLIEDYGTRGLIGDPEAWDPARISANSFYLFFRAIGRSGKSGEQRGRWGVGKFVFPLASHANCWFGYTRQEDTQDGLLMGRCVLRTHAIDDSSWHPDGTWGASRSQDRHILPLRDADPECARILKALRLTRRTEAGLSVVVPWLKGEIRPEAIIASVLREYFLPIVRGDLDVGIETDGLRFDITSETIVERVAEANDRLLAEFVSLAVRERELRIESLLVLDDATSDGVPEWSAGLMSEDKRTILNRRLEEGSPVMVRVPFEVRPKSGPARKTFVDVLFKADHDHGATAPLIIREGITIPDARARRLNGYTMLILIDDAPIASLVGDAENPAHTQLQVSLIKDKYKQGKRVLSFLRELGANIVQSLAGPENEEDASILASFFPAAEEGRSAQNKPARRRGTVSPLPTLPPRTQPRYQLRSVDGGFLLTSGKETTGSVREFRIMAAYEVRKGNPLKKYRPQDFRFTDSDISLDASGLEIVERQDNMLLVAPTEPDYILKVTGFDTNRNLFVKVTAQ